jgi:hypothetical protein
MTMVGTNPPLPNRPRSLLRFLAAWMASYVVALLLTATAIAFLLLAHIARATDSATILRAFAWLSLFPAGIAFGQWLLVRRYIRNALRWASAIYVAALLAQLSNMFVPDVTGETDWPGLFWVFEALSPIVAIGIAADVLIALPRALCFGAAWAIPPALAFPGSRATRIVWAVALMSTGFLLVVMVKTLSRELLTVLLHQYERTGVWVPSITSSVLPVFLAWLILALVSGAIMYWSLRHRPAVEIGQVYARFD